MQNVNEKQLIEESLSEDTVLWRYMSFECFASLITKSVLWFNRIDKFSDKAEGLYPPKFYNLSFLEDVYKAVPDYKWETGFGPKWQAKQLVYKHKMETRYRIRWAVNSWCMGHKDSEAMWATYSRLDSGIAVVSSFGHLRRAFTDPKWCVNIKPVHYIDRDSITFGEYYLSPFLCKDQSFYYEKELRAFIDLLQDEEDLPVLEFRIDLNKPSDEIKAPANSSLAKLDAISGANVKVSLEILISRIVLAPQTPEWIVELAQEMIQTAGLECDCGKSTLYDYPDLR